MTARPVYDCDDAACEAEGLPDTDVSEFEVRVPRGRDPDVLRDPMRRRFHLCDGCLEDVNIDPYSVVWIGAVFNEDEERYVVAGSEHRLRNYHHDGSDFIKWGPRGSVLFGSRWEDFFSRVEEIMDAHPGPLQSKEAIA